MVRFFMDTKNTRTCAHCGKTGVLARELCAACYQRCRSRGLPMPPRRNRSFDEWAMAAERTAEGCLLWPGRRAPTGYGHSTRQLGEMLVHRITYTRIHGPIPSGLSIDHVCHNRSADCAGGPTCVHRRCFEPSHLEAVPLAVNQARSPNVAQNRQTCPQGHPYAGENLRLASDRHRICRTCQNRSTLAHYYRRASPDRGLPSAQRTHCPKGHPYDAENTSIRSGSRRCKQCDRDRARERSRRNKPEGWVPPKDRTQCPQGHPYDIGRRPGQSGKYKCRQCARDSYHRAKAVKASG